jgi:hypothetical protein
MGELAMAVWKVGFREVLTMGTNQEGIKQIKKEVKERARSSNHYYGMFVEETVVELLSKSELVVKRTTPQMDIGFGADVQLSYKKDGKNFSFFLDITSNTGKNCDYFSLKGGVESEIENAFVYDMGGVKVRFGIKKKHGASFVYEKPVVVLQVSGLTTETDIDQSDVNNISAILMTLNEIMMDMGYGARASQLVYPNKSLYLKEYKEYLKTLQGGK